MIPEAAVEAAARAYFENEDWRPSWDFVEEPNRSAIRADLRAALEAAAPHMRQAFYLEMNARAVEDELNTPFRKATYSDD